MNRKRESGGGDAVPRVYDKSSGEYRPVSDRGGGAGDGRSEKFATPQRRAQVRRRRRRRALLLFYCFTFITVIAAAVALSLTVLFKIDTIQVVGTSRYSAEEVIRAGGIQKGENLFLAKTAEAGAKVQQKLPYICTAKVSRRLPAKIVITVSEEPVSGALKYNGKYAVIGTSGKILELADKMPENCPSIQGLKLSKVEVGKCIVYDDKTQQTAFQDISAAIAGTKLEKVTGIDLSVPYKMQIVYDKRITMNLGLASDLNYKLRFAKSILDGGNFKSDERGVLDLSVAADNEHAYFDPDYGTNSTASSNTAQNSSK